MTRFSGDTAGRALDVTAGTPSFEATLEGVPLSGDALPVRDGVWSLVGPDGRQIEVSVAFQSDGSVRAYAAGCLFGFELLDELTALALVASGGRSTRRIRRAVSPPRPAASGASEDRRGPASGSTPASRAEMSCRSTTIR